jgi:hypothetical protein
MNKQLFYFVFPQSGDDIKPIGVIEEGGKK